VVFGRIGATHHVNHADDPIVAAGLVIEASLTEFDAASAHTRLLADGILADVDGLFGGEATTGIATFTGPLHDGWHRRAGRFTAAAPHQIKRVAFGTALGIFDADNCRAALAGVANQLLATAAVDSGEAEVRSITRHGAGAFEAAPLSRLAGEIADNALIAADLDLGRAVHHDFNCAFTLIAITAAAYRGPALVLLRTKTGR
jgi:hypothetical protein